MMTNGHDGTVLCIWLARGRRGRLRAAEMVYHMARNEIVPLAQPGLADKELRLVFGIGIDGCIRRRPRGMKTSAYEGLRESAQIAAFYGLEIQ